MQILSDIMILRILWYDISRNYDKPTGFKGYYDLIFEWNVDIAPWLTSTGVWIVATQGKPHSEKCFRELGVSENSVPLKPMVNDPYPY